MKVYLIERISDADYDTFDSFVVVAESPTQALNTMPYFDNDKPPELIDWNEPDGTWVKSIDDLKVTLVSNTSCFKEWKIICSSFNAG